MPTQWTPILTPSEVATRLCRWGYYLDGDGEAESRAKGETSWESSALVAAIAMYQEWFEEPLSQRKHIAYDTTDDIVPDGIIGKVTESLMSIPRCGVPDRGAALREYQRSGIQEAKWPEPCQDKLSFALTFDVLQPLSQAATGRSFDDALDAWNDVLDVIMDRNDSLGQDARIWAGSGRLSGGVLAWSYLAQDSCAAHLQQRYNTNVSWNQRFLQAVSCHELGHALGLEHIQNQSALMYPYARQDVYLPHELDVRQAVRLGYREAPVTPPEPPEPPPGPDAKPWKLKAVYRDGHEVDYYHKDGGTDWVLS